MGQSYMHICQKKRDTHTWGVQYIVPLPSTRLSIIDPRQPVLTALVQSPLSYPSGPSSAQVSGVFPGS